ncbi:hypothetical protein [Ruminococcus sp.]|uniref:hypothetical protein n=1 Tax=Ruminococcus sp. TaxID=41978 RepID=UPI00388EDB57
MYNLPMISPENVSRDFIDVFGGYNHNYRINENEFYDMNNMTSSCFPLLASRQKRGSDNGNEDFYASHTIVGMLYSSSLYVVTIETRGGIPVFGSLTVYKRSDKNFNHLKNFAGISVGQYEYPRKLIKIGAYLLIFPDKVYVNLTDTSDSGKIEADFHTSETILVQACTSDGVPISFNHIGAELPENPLDGDIWLDTSDTKAVFKKWFGSNATWQSVIANNVLITGEDIDTTVFKEGDGIRISGFTNEKLTGLNGTSILHKVTDNGLVLSTLLDMNSIENDIELTQYPIEKFDIDHDQHISLVTILCKPIPGGGTYQANHFIDYVFTYTIATNSIQAKCTSSKASTANDDPDTMAEYHYKVDVYLDKEVAPSKKDYNLWADNYREINRFLVSDHITFARKMPKAMNLSMIIESKNRLWGCGFGRNDKGDYVNEIYASKLGDFKNWECFEGLSTDSYAASCGTDGEWTGAINYLGSPVFFKENYIHTVNGNFPAQFQISSIPARGVQQGSGNSLAIIDETLYYMSADGVCAYNGSLPMKISDAFGDERYANATACGYKGKYYINATEYSTQDYVLMVYDVNRGMWHKEDGIEISGDMCVAREDIFYKEISEPALKTLFGTVGQDNGPVNWFVETGKFGLSHPDSKYISRLNIRLSLDKEAEVIVSIQYNSSGIWERMCAIVRRDINPFTLPIKPRRCDHFQLRLEGKGGVKIYSIAKTIEQGSDR